MTESAKRSEFDEELFDVAGKDEEWHTAFYYLAEHVRYLSKNRINHKELYALVGVDGRYVNHANPLVRKRMAGALSRIVHTKRYVKDMQSRYMQSGLAFTHAAERLCHDIVEIGGYSDSELADYLIGPCWSSVYRGLEHERSSWRGGIDLFRAGWEMRILAYDGITETADTECARSALVMAALLHIIAFGHLDFSYAHAMVDRVPTGSMPALDAAFTDSLAACVLKFSDAEHSGIVGTWTLPTDRPFTIGRYTDCDIVETDIRLSRMHCCFYCIGGVWYFEDMGSRNGSVIANGDGTVAYRSDRDGAHAPIPLKQGDMIILAGHSHYWFGAQRGMPRYAHIGLSDFGEAGAA